MTKSFDDGHTVDEDASVTLNPLALDTDLDGDSLSIVSINGVALTPGVAQTIDTDNGTVSIDAAGVITFAPDANFNGTETFAYVITDGTATDTADETITVAAVNDPPVAVDDTNSTNEVTIISTDAAAGVIDPNDSDVDGGALTVTTFTNGPDTGTAGEDTIDGTNGGTFTIAADGSYTFNPDGDFEGLDAGETATTSVDYTISDGNGGFDTATLEITINGISNAGQIAPTGASVGDYINGTSENFEDFYTSDTNPDGHIQYNLSKKGGSHVSNTNPGVFFYYTGLSGDLVTEDADSDGTADPFSIYIDQENTDPDSEFAEFDVIKNDVKLYAVVDANENGSIDDGEEFLQVQLTADQIVLGSEDNDPPTSSGDVTVNYIPPAGTDSNLLYVLGVKYDTSTVSGTFATKSTPAVHYSFYTSVNGEVVEGDVGGIELSPKQNKNGKGALTLDDAPTTGGEVLTETALATVVDAAIDYWADQGVDAKGLESLLKTDVRIEDLGGNLLGKTTGVVVRLDDDAAGHGWSESLETVNADEVDLLSALTHEFGHVLGYDHDVMGETLSVGERDLPLDNVAADSDDAFDFSGFTGDLTSGNLVEDFNVGSDAPDTIDFQVDSEVLEPLDQGLLVNDTGLFDIE